MPTPRRRARPASSRIAPSASSIALPPPSRASSPAAGRATITKSSPSGSASARDQKASRSSRFTRLRSTAPPSLRPTETPSRGASRHPRAGTRRPPGGGWRASGPRGRRDRTHRCGTACGACDARGPATGPYGVSRLRPLSRRRLSKRRARARAHAGAEAVAAGALALLRLVGALHREDAAVRACRPRAGQGTRSPRGRPVHTLSTGAGGAVPESAPGFSRVLRAGARRPRRPPHSRM